MRLPPRRFRTLPLLPRVHSAPAQRLWPFAAGLELRFPVSLNPQATIYTLRFLEGGNNWLHFKDFNPYDMKRSAGVGFRIFLPMFGLLGLDWGYGFDNVKNLPAVGGSHFHFTIGQQF